MGPSLSLNFFNIQSYAWISSSKKYIPSPSQWSYFIALFFLKKIYFLFNNHILEYLIILLKKQDIISVEDLLNTHNK